MLKWNKLGRIFNPFDFPNRPLWMEEFAQCVSTLILDDVVRVFFSCRPKKDNNKQCVSYTTFLDLDKKDLTKIVRIADHPVLELGELGTFDEFGIYPTCVYKKDNKTYLYYAGWTRCVSVFASVGIGLAVSLDDGEYFQRLGKGPIMTRTLSEPFVISGPKVRQCNNDLQMYYLAGEKWVIHKSQSEAIYKIRMAKSVDGINWERSGNNIIKSILEEECQAGPDVFYRMGMYYMYFSYRYGLDFRNNDRGYRIGHAYSHDSINWTRDDTNAGIGLSDSGWDSIDMHYPHVFQLDNDFYMLYNGNEFGKYGFGLAKLEV